MFMRTRKSCTRGGADEVWGSFFAFVLSSLVGLGLFWNCQVFEVAYSLALHQHHHSTVAGRKMRVMQFL
jgi:hypothetical protein